MRPEVFDGPGSAQASRKEEEPMNKASAVATHESELPVTWIKPATGWPLPNLGELWAFRELLLFLVWRDVTVRYKQTAIGVGWAILQPVMAMVIFTLFFGRLAKMPSDGLPYPLFAYTALVPWMFFANGLVLSTNSLVSNKGLLTKIYFPRLAIPLAAVLGCTVDLSLALVTLGGMMIYFGVFPSSASWLVVAFVALALMTSFGAGLWLSALNVQYRDVGFTVPFLVQLWLFATPVVYPSSLLPEAWRTLYGINPMVSVVEGFRWALLGAKAPLPGTLAVSTITALALLVSGSLYFRSAERTFADVV